MVKTRLTSILTSSICIILTILAIVAGCSKKEKLIQVVPGKSIAGIELGMSEEQVIYLLGKPTSSFSGDDLDKTGRVYDVTPEGEYKPAEEIGNFKLLVYQKPPLGVLINKGNNKVTRLGLYYYENISVHDYPFLTFKYLTQDELNRLGMPTSKYRMKESEKVMMSKAPKGTIYEYYEYNYDLEGVNLGLVFDRTKQKSSKYFIGVNKIDIYSTPK